MSLEDLAGIGGESENKDVDGSNVVSQNNIRGAVYNSTQIGAHTKSQSISDSLDLPTIGTMSNTNAGEKLSSTMQEEISTNTSAASKIPQVLHSSNAGDYSEGQPLTPVRDLTSNAANSTSAAQSRAERLAEVESRDRNSASSAQHGVNPAIFFDNVTKIYDAQPDRPALENVTVRVYPGEFVFLVGHSGSGKSTFIRLINRELKPTAGNLYVAGENLSEMRSWRVPFLRRNIGCVFQDFKLLPKKTAFENVAFALEVIGKSKHIIKTQVPEVLRLVGLEEKIDKYPDQLSGGEQQRVSIARAIVNRPPLLICDEPTGNLDPQTSLGIMRLLDRINRTGTIVLVATHDKEMVNSMRRRVIALEGGHVLRDQDKGVYGIDA